MFDNTGIDQNLYTQVMEEIKRLNAEQMESLRGENRGSGHTLGEMTSDIKKGDFLSAYRLIKSKSKRYLRKQKEEKRMEREIEFQKPANYFSSKRIAIYTVITGDYDAILEPYCKPDNCDYYLFTNLDFDDSYSTWVKRGIPSFLKELSNAEQNRYLKMHPHEFFKEYEYSVYVDGNIQIFTDLTEYINRIGPIGLATHLHPDRDCVYEEMRHVADEKKETRENINRHLEYMKQTGMPHQYGLLECNVIAREHHNPLCVKIMEEWWKEYEGYAKRDQISLPHVLYKNGISVGEVGTLGNNVRINPSFRIMEHKVSGSRKV